MPVSVAIIGAGPAGFYTAEALLDRLPDVQIDIVERLATPFGLIRAGVAPDHQHTKLVTRRFEQTALEDVVHFYGNVAVGEAVSLAELRSFYDAIVLAVGAGVDRPLGIPGEHLAGVYGSALFVGWYNGHPDFRDLHPRLAAGTAVVIGNGNVALDVARVLVKSPAEMASSDLPDYAAAAIAASGIRDVYIVGRRTAADVKFTAAELREIGQLAEVETVIDPADLEVPVAAADARDRRLREKNLAILRGLASGPRGDAKRLHFRFGLAPVAIEGDDAVTAMLFRRTQAGADAMPVCLACGLVVAAIGYRASPLDGIPFDASRGLYPNDDGRVAPAVYVVGWAKRGPSGVIGSNRPDGETCAEQIAADTAARDTRLAKPGRAAREETLAARAVRTITFDDWQKIDAAEVAGARHPAPRRKFTTLGEMLSVLADRGRRDAARDDARHGSAVLQDD